MSGFDDLGDLSFDMDFADSNANTNKDTKKKPADDFADFGDFNFDEDKPQPKKDKDTEDFEFPEKPVRKGEPKPVPNFDDMDDFGDDFSFGKTNEPK